jgi:hypothetical protein
MARLGKYPAAERSALFGVLTSGIKRKNSTVWLFCMFVSLGGGGIHISLKDAPAPTSHLKPHHSATYMNPACILGCMEPHHPTTNLYTASVLCAGLTRDRGHRIMWGATHYVGLAEIQGRDLFGL